MTDMQAALRRIGLGVLALVLILAQQALAQEGDDDQSGEGESPPSKLAEYYGFGPMEVLKIEQDLSIPIIADINGDGLNDIVVVNNRKARIDILLQRKDFTPSQEGPAEVDDEDVNDIFGREKTWRFKRCSYDLDVAASSPVVADLNGDKLPDMAFYAKDGLRVVLQSARKPASSPAASLPTAGGQGARKPAGKGPQTASQPQTTRPEGPPEPTWLPAVKIDISENAAGDRSLAAGDLNGDKRTDLALLAGEAVYTVLQKEDGAMAKPVKHYCGGARPRQIDIADVNGDGRADLVVLTGEEDYPVSVRYQTAQGALGPEVRYELPVPAVMEVYSLGKEPKTCFVSVARQSDRITMSLLAPGPDKAEFPVLIYPLQASDEAGKRDAVAADLDGDGLKDLVVSDPGKSEFLMFKASATGLATPKRFPGLTDMSKLAAGDLEGKGLESVVVLSEKEKIVAVTRLDKERLAFPEPVTIAGEPYAMDLADVNGDGAGDLVYLSRDKDQKKYYLRSVLSLGRQDEQAGTPFELTELKDKPLDIRLADINHDGRCDVMVLRPYGAMLLVLQDEAGGFSQMTRADVHSGLVDGVQPEKLSLAPLGEGGKPAALLASKDFARALVFDDKKGWMIVDQYQAADPNSSLAAATACVLPGGSGPAIVTYDAARGKLEILTKQADNTYRADREVEVGAVSARKLLAGNFGGQASLSLLLCGANKVVLVPVAGKCDILEKVASLEPSIKGASYGALAAGDLNSDGIPEIVAVDQGRHHVEIVSFGPKGEMVSATKFKVFESPRGVERDTYAANRQRNPGEPKAARIGDVTGDGKADLVLLVHDRIIIYPQD